MVAADTTYSEQQATQLVRQAINMAGLLFDETEAK
jgi:hypothetical protein